MLLTNKIKNHYKPLLILFACCLANMAFAQDDSISYTTTEKGIEEWKGYRYFDNSQYEQKTLFKVNLSSNYGLEQRRGSAANINSFGVEHKVLPQLSVELEGMYFASFRTPGIGSFQQSWISPGIRYYPSKRPSAKKGNFNTNNFTGGYFRANYQHRFSNTKSIYATNFSNTINFSYGWQQKVGKFGQLDLAAEVTYVTETKSFFLGNRIRGGFGYGKSKTIKTSFEKKFDIKETLWSSPIIFANNPNVFVREGGFSLGVDIVAEFHILDYWTIRPSINGEYSNFRLNFNQPTDSRRTIYFNYDFNIEIRKYLGIRKKMAKGKSTLAFSGFYLTLQVADIYEREELVSAFVSTNDRNGFFSVPQVGFGWQHKVGSRFIFDVNWKLGYQYEWSRGINGSADLKIGILLRK